MAVTRQPQRFLVFSTCISGTTILNLLMTIVICVRLESTVYSRRVPSKDLACCISPVKRLLLLWTIRCYNPVADKMPPKIYFSCFLGTRFRKVKRTFLTPSRRPLNRFSWNLASLLRDSFPRKPCRLFVFFFCFWIIIIFSKEVLMICPLWLYLIVTNEQMHVSKIWDTVF